MIRKKIIALLCIVVLSTQMLPVQQIGSILFGNQINEEIPHSVEAGKDGCPKLLLKSDPFLHNLSADIYSIAGAAYEYAHFASLLPHNHAGEVQTPPPNIA